MTAMTGLSAREAELLAEEQVRLHAERDFGFWVYLMSDAVIFALLFATIGIMFRGMSGGPGPRELFDITHTFAETMLLLASSTTFGFVSVLANARKKGALLAWLGVTFVLGGGFLFLELQEFARMIAEGAGPQRSGFLSAFFTLVGTHGLHVTAGLFWITIMAIQIGAKGLSRPTLSRLYRLGIFWHFLDIIWIGIFSFVYLAGVI
jgi:cytochrome o ubiquinol oxidase subunit 3